MPPPSPPASDLQRDLMRRERGELKTSVFRRCQQFRKSDIDKLQLHHELQGHQECVNCIHWNEEGTLLASGSDDTHCIVWDPFRRRKVADVETGHEANIFGVNFVPQSNNALVATCAGDGRVKVWDINHRVEIYNDHSHFARVKRLTTAGDSPALIWSAGEDGLVIQHDLREPQMHANGENAPRPRRRALISMLAHTYAHELKCIAINPVHTHLMALGSADAYVRLFDRRMLTCRTISDPNASSTTEAIPLFRDADRFALPPRGCVRYYTPGHLSPVKLAALARACDAGGENGTSSGDNNRNNKRKKQVSCTHVAFSRDGAEILANFNAEQIYLFDLHADNLECRQFLPPVLCSENSVQATDDSLVAVVRDLKESANECFHKKQYFDAIRLYNLALKKCPKSSILWSNRSAALMKRKHDGDTYEALLNAYHAFCLNPQNDKACFRIIRNLIDLCRYDEARTWLVYLKSQQEQEHENRTISIDASSIHRVERELDDRQQQKNTRQKNTSGGESSSSSSSSTESSGGVALIKSARALSSNSNEDRLLSEQEKLYRSLALDYRQRFTGHCNSNTDIKEACFMGGYSQYIVAGSDDGSFYVWDKSTTNIVRAMRADSSIVNCIAVHPDVNMLATSGIDNVVRLWTPMQQSDGKNNNKTASVEKKPEMGSVIADYAVASEHNAQSMMRDPFERIFLNLRGDSFPLQMLLAAANRTNRRRNRNAPAPPSAEGDGAAAEEGNVNNENGDGDNNNEGGGGEEGEPSRVLPIQCTHQ